MAEWAGCEEQVQRAGQRRANRGTAARHSPGTPRSGCAGISVRCPLSLRTDNMGNPGPYPLAQKSLIEKRAYHGMKKPD